MEAVIRRLAIDTVFHFAAVASVPESIADPRTYWAVNCEGTRCVLDAMVSAGATHFVLSSTAAVYDHDAAMPIAEDAAKVPATPYGTSKLAAEHLARDYAHAYGLAAVALRYFNASGADQDGAHGECRRNETHLIPLLLAAAAGRRPVFCLFGDDWPTPDGTCLRDFVSVLDLARAHMLAARHAVRGRFATYNLGAGRGTSVWELISVARRVSGRAIPVEIAPRRPGDPPRLVADISAAARELGWRPEYSEVEDIVRHAWIWHSRNPDGYAGASVGSNDIAPSAGAIPC